MTVAIRAKAASKLLHVLSRLSRISALMRQTFVILGSNSAGCLTAFDEIDLAAMTVNDNSAVITHLIISCQDSFMTLAVVAAFARGTTRITNIAVSNLHCCLHN